MANISQILKNRGLKATPQRMAIYQALLSTTTHPCVETLHEQLKKTYPTLSLNTVYTNLEVLAKAGLIRKIDSGDCIIRYDGNPRPHVHMVCADCKRVEDLHEDIGINSVDMETRAEKLSGYKITDHAIYFFGLCQTCNLKVGQKG